MFRLLDRATRLCDGVTRREWLAISGLAALRGSLGGSFGGSLGAASASERSTGKAKSVIVVFLSGGPAQHDTWDPKPDTIPEIRGETQIINTSLPGLRVGELMPKTAMIAHHLCVLRAMTTFDNAHSSSGYWMLTGSPHTPLGVESARLGAPNNAPCLGAIVKALRPNVGHLPTAITLPERIINNPNIPWPGQDGGYLGRAADPWLLTCDPSSSAGQAAEMTSLADVPPLRVDQRRSLVEQVNRHAEVIDGRYDLERRQAFALLQNSTVRRAFDLDQEPASVRDRYGRSKFGQSVLLARRLVEAGVPFVHVNYPREPGDTSAGNPLWDTHQNHFPRMKQVLMPQFDAAYSSLILDLVQRGLLDETLVVLIAEFGRTPRINPNAGRDHWGPVFSAALAGGGVRSGLVYGSSDRVGAFPRDGQVSPHDLHATVLHCLGISPDATLRDIEGRQVHATRGTAIPQLI